MLTDLQICDYLQAQYDKTPGTFDIVESTEDVDWALKIFPDCTLLAFEGSHDIPDWISNFKASMVKSEYGGRVENGFNNGVSAALDVIIPEIPLNGDPVIIGGHSRGASHAHIATRGLIAHGFKADYIHRVVFGSPRVGDLEFCRGLEESPVTSYRNYGNFFDQDKVCQVPAYIPWFAPYHHPGAYTYVDIPGDPLDPWILLKRHHLFLYRKALI